MGTRLHCVSAMESLDRPGSVCVGVVCVGVCVDGMEWVECVWCSDVSCIQQRTPNDAVEWCDVCVRESCV